MTHTDRTMTTAGKLLIGSGVTVATLTGIMVAAARAAFDFAIDATTRAKTMERMERLGIEEPVDDTVHLDAEEEAAADDWFTESKQPVTTASEDGLTLHGWLFDPDCANPREHLYAICCHGYTGDPTEMAKYAHRYAALGFTVLTPALRAHELSEGRYVGMGYLDYRDLLCWIRVIVDSDPQARILLHGNSMGGAAVMMAAGSLELPRNVVAAIEDSGYASAWDQIVSTARRQYHLPNWLAKPFVGCMSLICRRRAGYSLRDASCVRKLRHATIPMLFIHGGDDDFVSPASLERNFDACASIDREKLLVPGAGHTLAASVAPTRYWRRVTNFVTRVFALR